MRRMNKFEHGVRSSGRHEFLTIQFKARSQIIREILNPHPEQVSFPGTSVSCCCAVVADRTTQFQSLVLATAVGSGIAPPSLCRAAKSLRPSAPYVAGNEVVVVLAYK